MDTAIETLGTLVIDLPRRVDEVLAGDIVKESAFVSPYLRRLAFNAARDAVELTVSEPEKASEVKEKTSRFLDAMLRRVHQFETKVFHRSERHDDGPYATGVNQELLRRGWLFDYGNGQMALAGPVLALSQAIDAKAAELYQRHFKAVPSHFPAMINADLLARCGYFDSHPNAVSFVGHMREDFDAIEVFRKANSGSAKAHLPHMDHVHLPGTCLNPAACFPCYPTLTGRQVGAAGQVFTWQGRVFRYESRNISGLDRLWEFNVRELVFVGSEDYVLECRRRSLPLIVELAALFDLDCRIETANDPFFATVSAAKTFWQRAQEVKNEIILAIEPGADGAARSLAAGSINVHGNFFGDRFDIAASDGGAAFTGCIGLGIERWVLAAFSQHGFDPGRWPAAVRSIVFG